MAKAMLLVERHLGGKHNQKTHANRFGSSGQIKESLRRLKDDKAARERLKATARKRLKKTGESTGAKSDFTPEYWDQLDQVNSIKKNGEFFPGELQEATDALDAERAISDAARKKGFTPNEMTASDWESVAGDLKNDALDDLELASLESRQAAGNKAVGRKRITDPNAGFIEVGGQTIEKKWTGGSRKAAAEAARKVNQQTQSTADDYMSRTLNEYGYSTGEINRLSYRQKQKVFNEIGQGRPLSKRVDGLNENRRLEVMRRTSDNQRMRANTIGLNPRAGRGADRWYNYEIAMSKAGKAGEIEPFPDVLGNAPRQTFEFAF